jgi:hypothetical protein
MWIQVILQHNQITKRRGSVGIPDLFTASTEESKKTLQGLKSLRE